MYQIIPVTDDAPAPGSSERGHRKPAHPEPFPHVSGMVSYRKIVEHAIKTGRIKSPGRYMVVSLMSRGDSISEVSAVFTVSEVPPTEPALVVE